jgi:uncharacterized protein (TIGR02231 family)
MKIRHAVLLLLFTQVFFAQEIVKEIEIKRATLYLKGAKVTGTTPVTLKKGRNFVKLINLSNDIDENTYKVGLVKNTNLMAITPLNNYLHTNKPSEIEQKLEAQKKKNTRSMDLLALQIKTLMGEQSIINANLQVHTNDKISPQEQLVKLTAFYAKRILEIENNLYLLQEQKNELANDNSNIVNQLAEERTNKNKNKKELLLEIESKTEMSFDLSVTYVVNSAGWLPLYDIRATDVKSPLEIVFKGKIYQKTGQDWTNVKLFVSTYLPQNNQNRPILSPLYVNEFVASANYNQLNNDNYKKIGVNVATNSYQMLNKASNTNEEASYFDLPVANVSDSQMNILYELNEIQTIKSQEKEQFLILDKKEVAATYKYHAVPKVNQSVYLLAIVKNWQNLNLISGEASLFFDDNYIGKTFLQSNYLNDEFPISLGIDERIVIKRRKIEDKDEKKFFNSNRKETASYDIVIRNNTKQVIDLEILDQLPISENEKIIVKSLTIGDGVYDEKTGSILWQRKLESGKTETINFTYELKYPKDMKIQYTNR